MQRNQGRAYYQGRVEKPRPARAVGVLHSACRRRRRCSADDCEPRVHARAGEAARQRREDRQTRRRAWCDRECERRGAPPARCLLYMMVTV